MPSLFVTNLELSPEAFQQNLFLHHVDDSLAGGAKRAGLLPIIASISQSGAPGGLASSVIR